MATAQTSLLNRIERVPLDSLILYPGNPRRGDVDAIADSMRANAQYEPLVVQASTRRVLAGNHRLLAAQSLGWEEVDVVLVEVDDEHARRIMLSSNRTSELGSFDEELLVAQLNALAELDGTGFGANDLVELESRLEALARLENPADPDEVPPAPVEAVSRPGEVYELGEHRLMCGDATDPEQIATLTGGGVAEVLWTDPPYGVNYVGKTRDALTIKNDDGDGLREMLEAAWGAVADHLAPSARFYCATPSWPPGELAFRLSLNAAGWRIHQTLIWAKDVFVLGHSDYHYSHEPILYGYLPGPGRPGRGPHDGTRWYGDHAQSSVFQVDRPKRSTDHPTMKPVELVAAQIANSSRAGDAILDPFAGSGSTLIAAEQTGRRCFAMEIDPVYCDVIRQRYADYVDRPDLAPGAGT